ncbi:hypothetical protein LY78DRAFT_43365 [Colletotrichum sublineola]|nr:hypothetical protein LY78DRAFT_43365 [Colletotrichum sublineola]
MASSHRIVQPSAFFFFFLAAHFLAGPRRFVTKAGWRAGWLTKVSVWLGYCTTTQMLGLTTGSRRLGEIGGAAAFPVNPPIHSKGNKIRIRCQHSLSTRQSNRLSTYLVPEEANEASCGERPTCIEYPKKRYWVEGYTQIGLSQRDVGGGGFKDGFSNDS